MLPSSGHKSISRISSEKNNTFGWYVRVVYGGEMHAKFFADAKYGTPEKALAQAIRHRNRVEREIGKPRTDRSVVAAKTTSAASTTSSRTGISRTGVSRTGVSRTGISRTGVAGVQRITKGGHEAFQVTWSPAPNVVSRTSVSITKYGEAEAFQRAVRLREKKERALYGKTVTPARAFQNASPALQTKTDKSRQATSSARSSTRSATAAKKTAVEPAAKTSQATSKKKRT